MSALIPIISTAGSPLTLPSRSTSVLGDEARVRAPEGGGCQREGCKTAHGVKVFASSGCHRHRRGDRADTGDAQVSQLAVLSNEDEPATATSPSTHARRSENCANCYTTEFVATPLQVLLAHTWKGARLRSDSEAWCS